MLGWLHEFLLCHQRGREGWRRLEWPDARPLLAQSWLRVQAFRTLADELDAVAQEQRVRHAPQEG